MNLADISIVILAVLGSVMPASTPGTPVEAAQPSSLPAPRLVDSGPRERGGYAILEAWKELSGPLGSRDTQFYVDLLASGEGGNLETLNPDKYRRSMSRLLKDYPQLAAGDDLKPLLRFFAWCTVRAGRQDSLSDEQLRQAYAQARNVFERCSELAQAELTERFGDKVPELSSLLDLSFSRADAEFLARVRELQEDCLFPALRRKLVESEIEYVVHDFQNPAFYPSAEEPSALMVDARGVYRRNLTGFIARLPNWVLASILITSVRNDIEAGTPWGPVLMSAVTTDTAWPALIRLFPAHGPTSFPDYQNTTKEPLVDLPSEPVRQEMEQDIVSSVVVRLGRSRTELPEDELAVLKQALADHLRDLPAPSIIREKPLPMTVRSELYNRPLVLISTDPEYCQAQARAKLFDMIAAEKLATVMPMLTVEEEQRTEREVARLFGYVKLSIQAHLGDVIPAAMLDSYLSSSQESIFTTMRSPISYWYKRVPATSEIDEIAQEFDRRLRATRHRAYTRLLDDLPDPESPRYEESLRKLQDFFLAEMLNGVESALIEITEIKQADRFDLDELVPGFSQAQKEANELRQREEAARNPSLIRRNLQSPR